MSTQESGGWLDEGRAQVKAKEAEKASKKPPEEPKAQPANKRLSMRDKILAATKGIKTASKLRDVLQDAKGCEESQEIVDNFVELIRQINDLAVHKLSSRMPVKEAVSTWEARTWEEQENQLAEWANSGDAEAQKRAELLPAFYEDAYSRENAPAKLFLREIVDQFVNPLRWINTIPGLKKFLDDWADAKTPLVKRFYNPKFETKDDDVVIEWGKDRILYLPKSGATKIARGWPYVKETYVRAKALEDKMNALRAKATPDFNPVKISQGCEGNLFLSISGKEAVLLAAKRQENGGIIVEVVDSVGVFEDKLPGKPCTWDAKLHKPATSNGNWGRVCKALEDWKAKREEAAKARKKAREDFLAPITRVATISDRFEDLGCTRILKGEKGVVALHRDNFHWKNKTKFFGIAVEHCENGTYVLRGVVSDHPFPRELVGEKLPLAVDHDAPTAKLEEQLPRMKQERWNALQMIVKILQVRLEQESKSAGSEHADAEEQENTSEQEVSVSGE